MCGDKETGNGLLQTRLVIGEYALIFNERGRSSQLFDLRQGIPLKMRDMIKHLLSQVLFVSVAEVGMALVSSGYEVFRGCLPIAIDYFLLFDKIKGKLLENCRKLY